MLKLSAQEIKHIKSLSQKKFRDQFGFFVVEGEKMVAEAIESGFEIEKFYSIEEIGEQQMERISALNSPSPKLAIVRMPKCTLHSASMDASNGFTNEISKEEIKDNGLYLALDSIRDPGNLGTIMRICDWFAVDGIFASYDTVDQFNPKVVQASMGAIFRKTVQYCDLKQLCLEFKQKGLEVHGTFLDGENLYKSEVKASGLIIMGNESRGISPELKELCSSSLLIPSYAEGTHAESLNVAIASAVIISEFKRRTL